MNLADLKGEELFTYLRSNKEELLREKKVSLAYDTSIKVARLQQTETEIDLLTKDTLDVTVVCSTAWICNSHMDVLTDKAFDKSISVRGNTIPHIHDHEHECTAHVGDTKKVYTSKMSVRDLGYDSDEKTTVLLMDSTVRKDYNEEVFKFYASGKINQHSIGFTYQDIKFAVNSDYEQDSTEKAIWDKYYPKIINKEAVDKRGYFWLIDEVDILENSCVLFGSNSLTPTLSIANLNTASEKILSLGNKEETVITQPIGNTMTPLEEAQGKIISLTEELAIAKAAIPVAEAAARLQEKQRTVGILKAQATFGNEEALKKAALDFVDKGTDIETATSMLEILKGHIQSATHVDTTLANLAASTTNPLQPSTANMSFEDELLGSMKALSEQPQLFKGVR